MQTESSERQTDSGIPSVTVAVISLSRTGEQSGIYLRIKKNVKSLAKSK
jgi:hypothetical protein